MTTSIDATEAIDEADVEDMVDAEAAAVVVLGELDGIATETAADGASADLEVWIELETSSAETAAFSLCLA